MILNLKFKETKKIMVDTSNLNSSINAILENNMFLKDADLT